MGTGMGAGQLRQRIRFERPNAIANGYGGHTAGFEAVFDDRAAYTRLRGSESVVAARLQGRQPTVIRVRASMRARGAKTAWRIVDRDSGEIFNIRSVAETNDRRWIDFLAESGVA